MAALLLGLLAEPMHKPAVDVALALELIDAAVSAHYYEPDREIGERLIVGDHWYARGMSIVADLARPELVRRLANATSDIARGHARSLDDSDADSVLELRSALFPAAVELAEVLGGTEIAGGLVDVARRLGVAREAVLARVPDARRRIAVAETVMAKVCSNVRLLDEQRPYLTCLVADLAHWQRSLDYRE